MEQTKNPERIPTHHLCVGSVLVDYPICECSRHRKSIPDLDLTVDEINKYWKEYSREKDCKCKIHRDVLPSIKFHGRNLFTSCHLCTDIDFVPRAFQVWLGYQLDPALKVIRDLKRIEYNSHTATDWGHADYALKRIAIIQKYVVEHLLQTEMARE